jgi:hypothetical protein
MGSEQVLALDEITKRFALGDFSIYHTLLRCAGFIVDIVLTFR